MEKTIRSDVYDGVIRTLWPTRCRVCNKKFYVPKNRLKNRKCCSLACSGKLRSKKIALVCAYCNKKFMRAGSKLVGSKSGLAFCCRGCKDAAQQIGGIVAIQPAHYGKGIYADYRVKAFKLHGKICKSCGYHQNEKMLDVHHIDGNRANNTAQNLRVWCVWCHALHTRRVRKHIWSGELV